MTRIPKPGGAELPFVLLNMAMTADGKIATADRAVHSFGGSKDREHLHELRATADAILCGARTVEDTNATLGNGGEKYRRRRLRNGLREHPLRVVVSGSASISTGLDIFRTGTSPLIVLASGRAPAARLAALAMLRCDVRVFGRNSLDFRAAFAWLRKRHGVKRLLCEGGGELNDALFRGGLVDEIHLTICPRIFGGAGAPTLADGKGFRNLDLTPCFKLKSKTAVNGELFTVFSRV